MIIIVQEATQRRIKVDQTYRRCRADLHNGEVEFIRLRDSWFVERVTGAELHESHKIEPNSYLTFICNAEPVTLFFSFHEDGIDDVKHYERKKVRIGSQVDCDIYLQHHHIGVMEFDPESGILKTIVQGKALWYVNGKVLKDQLIGTGDLIECMQFRMVVTPDSLAVNQIGFMYCRLGMISFDTPLQIQPIYPPEPLPRSSPMSFAIEPLTIEIPVFEPHEIEKRSGIMWPSIMMSLASLANVSLSMYFAYEQGRELIRMSGMILMPICMLIVALVIYPLQAYKANRKEKRKEEERKEKHEERILGIYKEADEYQEKIHQVHRDEMDMGILIEEVIMGKREGLWRYEQLSLCTGIGLMEAIITKGDDDRRHITTNMFVNLTKETKLILNDEDVFISYMYFLCAFHHPDQLKVIVTADRTWLVEHMYIYDLPHVYEDGLYLIASDRNTWMDIYETCGALKNAVVFAQHAFDFINDMNVPIISIDERIAGNVYLNEQEVIPYQIKADRSALALKLKEYRNDDRCMYSTSFIPMFGVRKVEDLPLLARWNERDTGKGLPFVIGWGKEHQPITMDLHEKGMGPHILIAGMTGSGKSVLIGNMILSMALSYHPEMVQFAIIDFKGDALAGSLMILPHVISSLSNLKVKEMERALIGLKNECIRRQKLFSQAQERLKTSRMDISIYQNAMHNLKELPGLAHLFIIIDEFAELKLSYPEFMKELISLARVGRSLGIHLVLCTQRPSGIVDDQILSNMRCRICLKVASRSDSREILSTDDAYDIREPGEFILSCEGVMVRGMTPYPYDAYMKDVNVHRTVLCDEQFREMEVIEDKGDLRSEFDVLLEHIPAMDKGKPLWLKPLEDISFDAFNRAVVIDDVENGEYVPLDIFACHTGILYLDRDHWHEFIRAAINEHLFNHPDVSCILITEDQEFHDLQERIEVCSTGSFRDMWESMEGDAHIIVDDGLGFFKAIRDGSDAEMLMLQRGITWMIGSYRFTGVLSRIEPFLKTKVVIGKIDNQTAMDFFHKVVNMDNEEDELTIWKDRRLLKGRLSHE